MSFSIPLEILQLLPKKWKEELQNLDQVCYEIRIRVGQPLTLRYANNFFVLINIKVSSDDIVNIIDNVCQNSLYAYENELRMGYFTINGGHRVGFVGQAIVNNGVLTRIKNFSSLNIRIARQIKNAALPIISNCWNQAYQKAYNILIFAAPGAGKTTMLRDLARLFSCGVKAIDIPPQQVAIVDERSEIASCYLGIPQLDVGCNTDVLDACPKYHGAMLILRSMAPQILVVDEIGSEKDALIVEECMNCGVSLFATAHANSFQELKKRPTLKKLYNNKLFQRIVFIKNQGDLVQIFNSDDELIGWCDDGHLS